MEFTKEQLIEWAQKHKKRAEEYLVAVPNDEYGLKDLALAEIALASLEAEAVCVIDQANLDYLKSGSDADVWPASRTEMGDVLLYRSTPPSPVSVPDVVSWEDVPEEITEDDMALASAWAHGFNQCRASMLQGAENAESRSSNSPVIPDGWALVPADPTEHMIVEGFESWPNEFFSDTEVWEAFQEMSGCQQSAHLAKLCWAAMIASAPKPEA